MNGNSRQARVNGGRSHVSLTVASALIVKVNGNSHKRCSTQRRPGEHLCPALPVPRVRLPAGDEQRGLARDAEGRHSGARSHRLRAVVSAARPGRALRHLSIHFFPASLCGACCHIKEERRDGRHHNHCDYTYSHRYSHIVLRVCLCFLLSHLLSQVHRRQKQLSDFVETKKYWTLPKSCGSQSSEWEERKKSRGKRGSLCARRKPRKTVTCHRLRVVEPVYHQAPLRGRWRSWKGSFAAGQAL